MRVLIKATGRDVSCYVQKLREAGLKVGNLIDYKSQGWSLPNYAVHADLEQLTDITAIITAVGMEIVIGPLMDYEKDIGQGCDLVIEIYDGYRE